MALAACALARRALGATAASAGAPALRSLPRARPAGQPIVLALTATHPTSAALGSLSAHLSSIGLVSPAWLALQPGGRFAYNAADAFTAGLAARGARLVPVLADPDHLAGELLADGPLRRRLAVRLGVAMRALGARGVVLDWRDLPPAARAALSGLRARAARRSSAPRAQIVVTVPPVRTQRALAHRRLRPARARAPGHGCSCWPGTSTARAASPGPVASLAFWKQTLRTVLRAAPRSRVLMGVPDLGLAVERPDGRGREQATQAQLFPKATRDGAAAALRRARRRERLGRVRPLRAAQAARRPPGEASPASRCGCAAASRPRPGRQPLAGAGRRRRSAPRGSRARPSNAASGSLPRGASGSRLRRRRSSSTTAPPTRPPTTTRRARRSRERRRHWTRR